MLDSRRQLLLALKDQGRIALCRYVLLPSCLSVIGQIWGFGKLAWFVKSVFLCLFAGRGGVSSLFVPQVLPQVLLQAFSRQVLGYSKIPMPHFQNHDAVSILNA